MNFVAGIDWAAPAVLASLAAASFATLGLAAVWRNTGWAERNSAYFAAFAAGVLLTTAIFLIPEGLESSVYAPFLVLFGYFLLYFINMLIDSNEKGVSNAFVPFLAVGFHSFIDGFEYGVLFGHDEYVGLMASAGLIAHEFAEGVLLFALLRLSGLGRNFSFIFAFIGAALTTPMGAIASQVILRDVEPDTIAMLLSIAAGALLYVGATHLTSHMREGQKHTTLLAYVLGLLLALGMTFVHVTSQKSYGSHSSVEMEDQ